MWFGIFLICIGVLYLLRNLGFIYGDIWEWVWPILIICIGIGLLIKPTPKTRHIQKQNHQPPSLL